MLAIIKREQNKQRAATYSGRKKRARRAGAPVGVAEPTGAMAARPGRKVVAQFCAPGVTPSKWLSDRA